MKIKNKYINKTDRITLALHFLSIILLILLSLGALRQNNLKMLELRDRVFEADKTGLELEKSLSDLRNHVTSHMNTELPKLGEQKAIQLKYSYERAVNAENQRFQNETNLISQKANEACANTKIGTERVNCEQNYIKNNPVEQKREILPLTYSVEFVSPVWSFDIAGYLMIATFLSVLFLLGRLIALRLAGKYLKANYN